MLALPGLRGLSWILFQPGLLTRSPHFRSFTISTLDRFGLGRLPSYRPWCRMETPFRPSNLQRRLSFMIFHSIIVLAFRMSRYIVYRELRLENKLILSCPFNEFYRLMLSATGADSIFEVIGCTRTKGAMGVWRRICRPGQSLESRNNR